MRRSRSSSGWAVLRGEIAYDDTQGFRAGNGKTLGGDVLLPEKLAPVSILKKLPRIRWDELLSGTISPSVDLTGWYREALDEVYRSSSSDAEKRQEKARLIGALGDEYARVRDQEWGGFRGYDRWFAQDINNATLASIGLYSAAKPAFTRLIDASPDLPAVWASLRALAALPRDERRARLDLPPAKEPTR